MLDANTFDDDDDDDDDDGTVLIVTKFNFLKRYRILY